MARWGGDGYSPDNCIYVDTWTDFVAACNEALPDGTSTRYRYITFPTVDQQGNPIPVERRIIDLRSRDWYRDWIAIIGPCWLHIEGNDWVILGLSLRDSTLFDLRISTNTSSRNWNSGNLIVRKLHFKNVYLQGHSRLFNLAGAGGSRVREVSGCKFSGVMDTSTISSPFDSTDFGIIVSTSTNYGYNVFTACSFNFKFVAWCRLSQDTTGTITNSADTEFNNCLFHFDGKMTKYMTSYLTTAISGGSKQPMFNSKFYFCKITGDFILDDTRSPSASNGSGLTYYPFFYDKGTLNVIDIKVSYYPFDEIQDNDVYLEVGSSGSSQTQIMFIEYPPAATKNMSIYYIANRATFHIPSSRQQLTDETWLTQNGFVVGTPPTE